MVLDFAPPRFSCSGTLPAPVDLINESNLPFSLYDNPRKPTCPWANSRQYTPLDYRRTGGLQCKQDQLFDVNNCCCRRTYPDHLRCGGPPDGDRCLGSFGPHLREGAESGAAALGGVQGSGVLVPCTATKGRPAESSEAYIPAHGFLRLYISTHAVVTRCRHTQYWKQYYANVLL